MGVVSNRPVDAGNVAIKRLRLLYTYTRCSLITTRANPMATRPRCGSDTGGNVDVVVVCGTEVAGTVDAGTVSGVVVSVPSAAANPAGTIVVMAKSIVARRCGKDITSRG